jgi:hypothetical protein
VPNVKQYFSLMESQADALPASNFMHSSSLSMSSINQRREMKKTRNLPKREKESGGFKSFIVQRYLAKFLLAEILPGLDVRPR